MPIYEYRCTECQQLFEEWCKRFEDGETEHACPICKGKANRLISHTSFALKGGGWYVTEYGSHKGIKEDGAASSSATAPSCTANADAGNCAAKDAGSCAASCSAAKDAGGTASPRSADKGGGTAPAAPVGA